MKGLPSDMELWLRGTDIRRLSCRLTDDQRVVAAHVYEVPPEEYLRAVVDFVAGAGGSFEAVTELRVVVGEGAATAIRALVTLANVQAWARGLKRLARTVPQGATDDEAFASGASDWQEVPFFLPAYASAPHITTSTHDQLKRAL